MGESEKRVAVWREGRGMKKGFVGETQRGCGGEKIGHGHFSLKHKWKLGFWVNERSF